MVSLQVENVNFVILGFLRHDELRKCVVNTQTSQTVKAYALLQYKDRKVKEHWHIADILTYVDMHKRGFSSLVKYTCPIFRKVKIRYGLNINQYERFMLPRNVHMGCERKLIYKNLNHYNLLELISLAIDVHGSLYKTRKRRNLYIELGKQKFKKGVAIKDPLLWTPEQEKTWIELCQILCGSISEMRKKKRSWDDISV